MAWLRGKVAVVLLLLLAGCLHAPPGKRGADALDAQPAQQVVARHDQAAATYEWRREGAVDETTLSFQPQSVWNRAFAQVPGLVAAIATRSATFDPVTGNTLTTSNDFYRAGLDACGSPLWLWRGEDNMDGVGVFFARGERNAPGWREAVAALRPDDLPDDRQRVIGHGDYLLHVGVVAGGWRMAWSTSPEPLADEALWSTGWRLDWDRAEPFPSRVSNDTETWIRSAMSNDGGVVADCFVGRDVATIAWGPWGPDQDPPLPISWNDLVTAVRNDATLANVQRLLTARPDAYLRTVIADPGLDDGLPNVPGVLEDAPPQWSLEFGAPGLLQGPAVLCKTFDGGPERPDAYQCQDQFQSWNSSHPLPDPDWSALRAHDLGPWFEFLQRYGRPADWLLFRLDGPDVNNERPLAVLLAAASDEYTVDHHYVHWDPQDPDSYVVLGFSWEEFLHPPLA